MSKYNKHIGIDFHKNFSYVMVMDKYGTITDQRKLFHAEVQEVIRYFSSFSDSHNISVVLEATRNWYWMVNLLQTIGFDVKLAHSKKVRIIAESTIKTDKIDASVLAHLDRCNFLPQAYIADKDTRSMRELLRYRMSLVKIRSSIKNRIHAVLSKHNISHPFSDLFGKAGIKFLKELDLPPIFRMETDGYLNILEHLRLLLSEIEKEIKNKCRENEYAKLLMGIPGISYFSALLLAAEIADITRFKTFKKLVSYAGLASSTKQTGDIRYQGHIIRDSNKYIRYAVIEAVPHAIKKDCKLFALYNKVNRKKGNKKAKIAVARKLIIFIYFMLKNNTDYLGNRDYILEVNPMTKLGAYKAP